MADSNKIKRYIAIGLLGALITVCGEMLQGAVPSGEASDKMGMLFSSFDNLPVWRIGLGSTVGALGILLQFFGVYGIYLSFTNKESKTAKIYQAGMYVFSILGSIVHVLMSMMIDAYRISIEHMMEVTIWFVAPIVFLFFLGYIPFAIAMALQFWRRQTIFPKWLFWLNPLFGKVFFNVITTLLPNSALVNGISFSNMGLSSVVLFTAILWYIKKQGEQEMY